MKKSATVKFVCDPAYYRIGCDESGFAYCRDCKLFGNECEKSTAFNFLARQLYNAYFLEYWQGKRDSLIVKGEDGKIADFIPLCDFEITEDCDGVLHTHEATVRCTTDRYRDLQCGKEYIALGYSIYGNYLVKDESGDCYFYLGDCFDILQDPNGILDKEKTPPVYDWANTHTDSV